MAQKAAATITPVVARNGCAEDVQEVAKRHVVTCCGCFMTKALVLLCC